MKLRGYCLKQKAPLIFTSDMSYKDKYNHFKSYLRDTISGKIPVDRFHPYINDIDFLKLLKDGFEKLDTVMGYKICALIKERIDILERGGHPDDGEFDNKKVII